MSDLSDYGIERPAIPPRGPSKRPGPAGTRVEVHRLGPGAFEVTLSGTSARTGKFWRQRFRVPRERVAALWDVCLMLHEGLASDVIPRDRILAVLIHRKGGAVALLRPEEAAQGIFRAGFYDPEYHFPCLVLEYYHRRIERVGRRAIRVHAGTDLIL